MQLIDDALLDTLSKKARQSARLRMNHNLHSSFAEPCQRMLNAVEPGSYVRPHRHLEPPRAESFLALRGQVAVLLFADDGTLRQVLPLHPGGSLFGVDIAPGRWHSLFSVESGAVFFETKPGPYHPLSDKEFAPWAPVEDSSGAASYLAGLEQAVARVLQGEGAEL